MFQDHSELEGTILAYINRNDGQNYKEYIYFYKLKKTTDMRLKVFKGLIRFG